MIRRSLACLLLAFAHITATAQQHPRLVVLISLDQCRQDYLERFRPAFGTGGFERFRTSGASFVNSSFGHARTSTGPGHAAMLTGSYGDVNGIVANHWFDRATGRMVYCVEDDSSLAVGSPGNGASPRNLATYTLGDELKIRSGFLSKVVSLSHKDRAAVLMGGKLADLALWLRDSVFVTSTYYRSALPAWVERFNRSRRFARYVRKTWNLSPAAARLAPRFADDVSWEDGGAGLGRTFPHRITGTDTSRLTKSFFAALLTSPYGNEILADLAKEAVRAETLGRRGVTDLLCVSFSGTDYMGHAYGPYSLEVADMMVRMDALLADFFRFLDARIGRGKYVVVLTSDHGVAPAPEFLLRHRPQLDAGRISGKTIRAGVDSALAQLYGAPAGSKDWNIRIEGGSVYLDGALLKKHGIDPLTAARELARMLPSIRGIGPAAATEDLLRSGGTTSLERRLRRSCFPGRVGDVVFALRPYVVEDEGSTGASHGEPYEYDSHVPLLIMGPGVTPGRYVREVSPVDIAPTLSVLLGVEFPPAREGRVLSEAIALQR
jgi:predicted AlkP superfamily pyrophosphatase or phosphodiesterase